MKNHWKKHLKKKNVWKKNGCYTIEKQQSKKNKSWKSQKDHQHHPLRVSFWWFLMAFL